MIDLRRCGREARGRRGSAGYARLRADVMSDAQKLMLLWRCKMTFADVKERGGKRNDLNEKVTLAQRTLLK